MQLDEVFDRRYLPFSDALVPQAAADLDAILMMSRLGPGALFLDVGCGEGRLVREAARRGLHATGVDASPDMIAEARRRTVRDGLAATFIKWDMRVGPAPGQWDGAASWYTSFGYFDDETCRAMLCHIRASLRVDGVFVMDLVDKDQLLPRLAKTITYNFIDGGRVSDRLTYDPIASRLATHRTYSSPAAGEVRFEIRLLAFAELEAWLTEAGFVHVTAALGASAAPGRLRVTARA